MPRSSLESFSVKNQVKTAAVFGSAGGTVALRFSFHGREREATACPGTQKLNLIALTIDDAHMIDLKKSPKIR